MTNPQSPFNTLALRLLPRSRRPLVEIFIDDVPLLELVRNEEADLTEREFQGRVAAGEDPEGLRIEPGSYMYPVAEEIDRDGRLGFGLVEQHFQVAPEEPEYGKTVLLGCDCGEPSCWMLIARVSESKDQVTWSDFAQYHRPEWHYALGPFTFERNQYESEIHALQRQEQKESS